MVVSGGKEDNGLIIIDQKYLKRVPLLRRFIKFYFKPRQFEMYRNGIVYRILGVHWLAYIIPTGGQLWRRLFKWDGWSFALRGSSLEMAKEYRYSTCVFESLHLFAITLFIPGLIRGLPHYPAEAIEHFLIVGLLMNIYPLMLQRYNRVRIERLIEIKEKRKS